VTDASQSFVPPDDRIVSGVSPGAFLYVDAISNTKADTNLVGPFLVEMTVIFDNAPPISME
jgi:hypothetical protein